MKDSKYVESYYIQKFASGIYLLSFLTTEEGCTCSQINPTHFIIETANILQFDDDKDVIQEIPANLIPTEGYVSSMFQYGDEISYYFIPQSLMGKDSETIYNSRIKTEI